jgi:hypothetical protein
MGRIHPIRQKYRKPSAAQPGRSTRSAFSDNDLLAYLNGEWVLVPLSSNVKYVRYVESTERVEIQFDDGTRYYYAPITYDLAEAFGRADSKGGFLHDHLKQYGGVKF